MLALHILLPLVAVEQEEYLHLALQQADQILFLVL
jgi:hypothetical protein